MAKMEGRVKKLSFFHTPIFPYLEHFSTMAQVLFSLKSYIASVSYDNVL